MSSRREAEIARIKEEQKFRDARDIAIAKQRLDESAAEPHALLLDEALERKLEEWQDDHEP